ncbi:hypothetical protein GUJ93_ZPchr0009g1079 [Zizania palustris]|uniref:Uncharacterized protein n=1 Tax=Zizania palustris TaxID=103762 RepID=A0A8J5RX29_ZIZPA|nr:hypothetical protein GUJ93_ZPchr0009g1079 [Zizania palustris]
MLRRRLCPLRCRPPDLLPLAPSAAGSASPCATGPPGRLYFPSPCELHRRLCPLRRRPPDRLYFPSPCAAPPPLLTPPLLPRRSRQQQAPGSRRQHAAVEGSRRQAEDMCAMDMFAEMLSADLCLPILIGRLGDA